MSSANIANSITTRPVAPGDEAFLLEVYQSSRGDDLRGLGWAEDRISEFLAMQYEAQRNFFEIEYQRANDEIILLSGEPAGRLTVVRREQEIRCLDMALLPAHRNRGVGGHLIARLQSEARRESKPLRLQVIRFSPAVNLFERTGFLRTAETGTHLQMEWTP